jgi:hypothetical protein
MPTIQASEKWSAPYFDRGQSVWAADREWTVSFSKASSGYSGNIPGYFVSGVAGLYPNVSGPYLTNDINGEQHAIDAIGVKKNDAHPDNQWMVCDDIYAKSSGFGVWLVHAHYSSTEGIGRFVDAGNPLNEPPYYYWDFSSCSEPTDRDIYGNVVANTNGDPFENLPQRDVGIAVIKVQKNLPVYDFATALDFQNSINSCTWVFGPSGEWEAGPGKAKLKYIKPITPITTTTESLGYVKVEYCAEIKESYSPNMITDFGISGFSGIYDSWTFRVANAGQMCFYSGVAGPAKGKIAIKNAGPLLEPISQDILLDIQGKPLGDNYQVIGIGGNGTDPSPSPSTYPSMGVGTDGNGTGYNTPIFLIYQVQKLRNFNDLNL